MLPKCTAYPFQGLLLEHLGDGDVDNSIERSTRRTLLHSLRGKNAISFSQNLIPSATVLGISSTRGWCVGQTLLRPNRCYGDQRPLR